jgi:hypothetical protein
MVPSATTLLLNPKTRHLVPEQETDFCALVAAGPANTVTPLMSGEKLKFHWIPTIWAPPEDVKLIGTDTVAPGVAEPDPMESLALCAKTNGTHCDISIAATSPCPTRNRWRMGTEIPPNIFLV